jgi:hypothetical protein
MKDCNLLSTKPAIWKELNCQVIEATSLSRLELKQE